MSKRKICVVTGTRAEYGLLFWLMKEIKNDPELQLQIIATGMHLSPEFGLTYRQIEQDGFDIDEKVEMLLSSDTPVGITKSLGLGTIGFADALDRLKPNILVLLGDRFEILAAAQAALIARIPIAHIHGGEVTYGAYDDSIRHAVTKMSYLHFVTTEEYRNRVIQLGEHPERVFNVGAPGIEYIKKMEFISIKELEDSLKVKLDEPIFVVTHHPTTLSINPIEGTKEILTALDEYKNATVIFTKANADDSGRKINKLFSDYVKQHPTNSRIFDSLGQLRYLSLMKYASLVIGNSSSGIYEAPYLNTPTVNVGNRQEGRIKPESVFDCEPNVKDIIRAIQSALEYKFSLGIESNIYGDGNTSFKIYQVLKKVELNTKSKEFYDGAV